MINSDHRGILQLLLILLLMARTNLLDGQIKEDTLSYNNQFKRAQVFAQNQEYDQAITIFSNLLERYPNDADIRLARGRVLGWNGQYSAALEDIRKVTYQYPEYIDAWSALGDIFTWSGKPDSAIWAYSRGLEQEQTNPALLLGRARVCLIQNQLDIAEKDLNLVDSLGIQSPKIEEMKQALGRKKQALVQVKLDSLNTLAEVIFNNQQYESAGNLYRQILEIDPDQYQAKIQYAHSLARSGSLKKAIAVYTELLTRDPQDADARLARGLAQSWSGNYTSALRDLDAVTRQFPQYTEAWVALANVYRRQEEPDQALAVFNRWISINPKNGEAYHQRAEFYRTLRQYPQSREDLLKALEQGDHQRSIRQELRRLNRITLSTKWEGRISYDIQTYSNSKRKNWTQFNGSIKREVEQGSFIFNAFQASRFGKTDQAVTLEIFYDLWDRSYFNLRWQQAPKVEILPGRDLNFDLYQGLGTGWEVSAGYRNMHYPKLDVHFGTFSAARYSGSWYLRENTTFFGSAQSQGFSEGLLIRRYLATVDDFLELRTGLGQALVLVGSGPSIEKRSSNYLVFSWQKFFGVTWGSILTISINNNEKIPTRSGIVVELIFRK